MPDLYCGNCGNLAKSLNNCGHCNGPVFDLGTPQGVIDCRTYRELRSEQSQQVTHGNFTLYGGLLALAISGLMLELLDLCTWCILDAVFYVGMGVAWACYRRSRTSPERLLDARLEQPDPFHDPRAPEPSRASARTPTGARA